MLRQRTLGQAYKEINYKEKSLTLCGLKQLLKEKNHVGKRPKAEYLRGPKAENLRTSP